MQINSFNGQCIWVLQLLILVCRQILACKVSYYELQCLILSSNPSNTSLCVLFFYSFCCNVIIIFFQPSFLAFCGDRRILPFHVYELNIALTSNISNSILQSEAKFLFSLHYLDLALWY